MKNHYKIPEVVTGYPLTENEGWFSVVMPEERTNLVTNPKVEEAMTGYTAAAGTIEHSSTYQRRGLYSVKKVAGGAVYYGTVPTVAATVYAFSVDVRIKAGTKYYIYVASTAGARVSELAEFVGNGDWQRPHVIFPEISTTTRRLYVSSTGADDYYTDGWQFEEGDEPTTYIDGDLDGFVNGDIAYYWDGLPNESVSTRSGTSRHGGRIVNLDDYGVMVTGIGGLRMPTYKIASNQMTKGGSLYQGSIPASREFSLVCTMFGERYGDLDRNFAELEAMLNPKMVANDQELFLVYHRSDEDGNETKRIFIPCVYAGGLEGVVSNPYQEPFALTFFQPKMELYEDGSMGMIILPGNVIADSPGIIRQDYFTKTWETLNAGASDDSTIQAMIEASDGNIYIGGTFTKLGGVSANNFIKYDPAAKTFTNVCTGAGFDSTVHAIVEDVPAGALYIVGAFQNVDGVARARIVKYYLSTGAFAAIADDGVNSIIYDAVIDENDRRVFVVGAFTEYGSGGGAVASKRAAYFNVRQLKGGPNTTEEWVTMETAARALNATAHGVELKTNGDPVVGGLFTDIAVATGVPTPGGVAFFDMGKGYFEKYDSGLTTSTNSRKLSRDLQGNLYIARLTAGDSFARTTVTGDGGWIDISQGLVDVRRVYTDPFTGSIIISLDSQDAPFNEPYLIYRNGGMERLDITTFQDVGERVLRTERYLYLPTYTGSIFGPSSTVVENIKSKAIPKFKFQGPGVIQRIENVTSGQVVYMNYSLADDERITITLGDSMKTTSDVRASVLPGSSPWFLLPGDNLIRVFVSAPYSEYGDTNDDLTAWELVTGITKSNTDNGTLYGEMPENAIGPGNYSINLYKDEAMTALVGHTAVFSTFGEKAIVADNSSGLGGVVRVAGLTAEITEFSVKFGFVALTWQTVYDSLSKVNL